MAQTKRPGAYIKEGPSNVPATIADSIKNVGIVGCASPYYAVNNISLIRGEGATDFLVIDGITSTGATNLVMQNNYIEDRDYTFDSTTGEIVWLGDAVAYPEIGSTYYVNCNMPKTEEYYLPQECYDIEEVVNIAGPVILRDGKINEITLAAQIAKENGADKVTFVQVVCGTNGAYTETNWKAALKKLEDVKVNVLVAPGATTSSMQAALLNHVTQMSSYTERAERIAFVCPTSDTISDIVEQAEGLDSDRMVLMFPPTCQVRLADDDGNEQAYEVNSTYLGAAICGLMTDVDRDEASPITWQNLAGFSGLDGKFYKDSKYNTLTSGGVCCVFNNNGVIKVNQAVTTNTSSVDKIELSVRNIKDTIQYQSRQLMERNFVGTKLFIDEIIPKAKSLLDNFCQQKVTEQVFNPKDGDAGYGDIAISQSPNDPRTLLVYFKFRPVFTLTWVEISYQINI